MYEFHMFAIDAELEKSLNKFQAWAAEHRVKIIHQTELQAACKLLITTYSPYCQREAAKTQRVLTDDRALLGENSYLNGEQE